MKKSNDKMVMKYESTGKGVFFQLLGLFLCFVAPPFGLVVGIMLFVAGSYYSRVYRCAACRTKVEKEARVCPACRADLSSR